MPDTKLKPKENTNSALKLRRPKGLRYLLVFILVFWAVSSLLARYLLSDINDYARQIENIVAEKSDFKITIGKLSARWLHYSPAIYLDDISVFADKENNFKELLPATDKGTGQFQKEPQILHSEILTIKHFAFEIDLIESLFTFSPRFKNFLVNDLDVDTVQLLAVTENESKDDKDFSLLIKKILDEYIFTTEHIFINRTQLKLQTSDIGNIELNIPSLVLESEWLNRDLSFNAILNSKRKTQQNISARISFEGNPLSVESFSAKAFLNIEKSETESWLNEISLADYRLEKLNAGIQLWLEINQGNLNSISTVIQDAEFKLSHRDIESFDTVENISFRTNWSGALALNDFKTATVNEVFKNSAHKIKVSNVSMKWGDFSWQNLNFLLEQDRVIRLPAPLTKRWSSFESVSFFEEDLDPTWENESDSLINDKQVVLMQRAAFSSVPLALSQQLVKHFPPLSKFISIVQEAKPQGEVKQVQVLTYSKKNQPVDLYASFFVENLGLESLEKIPSIKGFDAYIEIAPQAIGIELNSEDVRLYEHAKLFRRNVKVKKATGKLFIEKLPNDIVLHSNVIHMSNDWADLRTSFFMNIPDRYYRDGEKELLAWSLMLNFDPVDAANTKILFPDVLPEEFLSWLDNALLQSETHGDLFILSFAKKYKEETFFAMDADVKLDEGKLDYMPGQWPSLSALSANIVMHDDSLRADIDSAYIYDTRLRNAKLNIPSLREPRIKIEGDVEGSLMDIRRLFLESELKESLGEVVEDWDLKGSHKSKLSLDMPLSDESDHSLALDINVDDASLYIKSLDLSLKNMKSILKYSLESGLRSDSIKGEFFNKPFEGMIKTTKVFDDELVQISAKGRVAGEDIKNWQDFWLFNNLVGETDFESRILIGDISAVNQHSKILGEQGLASNLKNSLILSTDNNFIEKQPLVRIDIKSQLEGMAIGLPGAYNKAADSSKDTKIQLDILPESSIYRVNFNNEVGVSAKLKGDDFDRARVNFGSGLFPLPPDEGLTITGSIGDLKYEEWLSYIEKNILDEPLDTHKLEENDNKKHQAAEVDSADILNRIDITINKFFGFGQQLTNLKTFVTREKLAWRIELSNDMVSGVMIVPDENLISKDNPIIAKLDYLKMDSPEAPSEPSKKNKKKVKLNDADVEKSKVKDNVATEAYKPSDFVFLSLDVKNVTIDGEKQGKWQVDFLPREDGLDFNVHQLNYNLMTINGKGNWEYSREKSHTYFKGKLRTAAATRLFSLLSLKPSSESTGLMSISLNWPGSPLDYDSDKSKGTVGLRVLDGSIVEVDINSKKFRALGIFNLGVLTDIVTLKIFKKIGKKIEAVFDGDKKDDKDKK